MADFLAILSEAHLDNWEICKLERLWGTSRRGVGAAHAKRVTAGDRMFVWAGGEGLLAVAEIAGGRRPVRSLSEVPWPDPGRYGFVFPIAVVAELDVPYVDEFREGRGGNRTSRRLGLKGWQLQSGFAELTPEQGRACAAVFDLPPVSTPQTGGGEGHREPLAAVFLRSGGDVAAALLSLYRQRELCADGELLVVGEEEHRAAVESELGREPFLELAGCVRFTTRDELGAELRHRLTEEREP